MSGQQTKETTTSQPNSNEKSIPAESVNIQQDVAYGLKLLNQEVKTLCQNIKQNECGTSDLNAFGSVDYSRVRQEMNQIINHIIHGFKNYQNVVITGNRQVLSDQNNVSDDSVETLKKEAEKSVRRSGIVFKELGDMRNKLGGLIQDLRECQGQLRDAHDAVNGDTTTVTIANSQGGKIQQNDIVEKLEKIANELGLVSYVDSSNDSQGKQLKNVTICGDILVLDIDVDSDSVIQKVKLSFASETEHNQMADLLFAQSIKKLDFNKLEADLSVLAKLEKLNKKYKPVEFFHATNALSKTLDIVSEIEMKQFDGSGIDKLLVKGSGIPIHFFNRPGPQLLFYTPKVVLSSIKNTPDVLNQLKNLPDTVGSPGNNKQALLSKVMESSYSMWIDWEPHLFSNNQKQQQQMFLPLPYKTFVVEDPANFSNFSKLRVIDYKHPTIDGLTIKYVEQPLHQQENQSGSIDQSGPMPPYISVLRFDKPVISGGQTIREIKKVLTQTNTNSITTNATTGANASNVGDSANGGNSSIEDDGNFFDDHSNSLERHLGYDINNDGVIDEYGIDITFSLSTLPTPSFSISRIPFQHPKSIPAIVSILRRQLRFNELLSSVFRPPAPNSNESTNVAGYSVDVEVLADKFTINLNLRKDGDQSAKQVVVEDDQMDVDETKRPENEQEKFQVVVLENGDINVVGNNNILTNIFNQCGDIPMALALYNLTQ